MTNLLRRALRRVLDFAYRLDREAMWQQWERDHVAPLRGQVGILNQGMADLKDERDAFRTYNEHLWEQVDELRAKLSEAEKTIAQLSKASAPVWDGRDRVTCGPDSRTPWYRR